MGAYVFILGKLISSSLYDETFRRSTLKFGSVPVRGKGLNYNPVMQRSILKTDKERHI